MDEFGMSSLDPAAEQGPTGVDPARFRHALGHFCSGIVIVTAMEGGRPVGLTCQSFLSLSLDPPLVGFSPAKTSLSYPSIRQAGSFCSIMLTEEQGVLCAGFARSNVDKWLGVQWSPGTTGSPMLDGALASIDCLIEAEYDAGDHFFVVGKVIDVVTSEAEPLLFFRGGYRVLGGETAVPA